jgi:two-component system chemotaxis response regulator CheY
MAILVVDDSRAMRMIMLRELRKAGYETRDVAEAENGRDALQKVHAGGVNLVLSDWNMPEMNGMSLLVALRREGNDIPFGFVTSESTPLVHRDALDAGADFVVTKPFTADTLALQVERALQGVRQGDGLGAALAPKQQSLAEMLEELLGRDVTTRPSTPPRLASAGAIGRYRGDNESTRALLIAELEVAASMGAALSCIPRGVVEEEAKAGRLSEIVETNLFEVFNVLSKAVPGYEERWRLDGMKVIAELGEHQEVWDARPDTWRSCVTVSIDGYPSGRIGFLRV